MAFTRLGIPNHDVLPGVSTADHHTATVAGDLNLADLSARAHADLSDSPANAHHNLAHNLDSHPTRAHSDLSDAPLNAHMNEVTQNGMESESTTGVFLRPSRMRFSPGVCKVWGTVNQDGTLGNVSYNVASVTDTGTGDRTVVIDDDFSATEYTTVADVRNDAHQNTTIVTVGSIHIELFNHTPAAFDTKHSFAMFGDQ